MSMTKPKLIRITTVPLSLEKLLEGQLPYMQQFYEVTAISSDKERLDAFGEANKVATFWLQLTRKITPIQDVRALIKLYHFLRKEKPLIVHTHTPKAGIVGMTAAFFAGVPLRLHTVAGLPLMESSGFKKWLLNAVERVTYRFATNVYPNSRGLYDFILSKKLTSESKLKIIANGSSNGINTSHFSKAHFSKTEIQEKRNELSISETDFVFLFVGRIVKDKGIVELVNAFVALQKDNQNNKLLLVGPYEEDLDPLPLNSKETILQHPNIITTGYQEDVRVYFALSNALVFPSYREGFPNVVLQAGAMELPAIVTNINGCNEIITNGHNGLLIPAKNTEVLLEKMKLLQSDTQLYAQLKANSRAEVVKKHQQQEVWDALLEEYRRLEANL